MTTLHEIESAVSALSPDELFRFRQWFVEFDAQQWDQQFENDVRMGKLDRLAEQALEQARAGQCKQL